jgi:type III pantothenate kinase
MLLAIDAGNTNTTFALFADSGAPQAVWRTKTDSGKTADDYAAWLWVMLARHGLAHTAISRAILASVVPESDYALRMLCRDLFGEEPFRVTAQTVPMPISLPNPQEVGADRLVNAFAAAKLYGCPAIVLDFGTATTFDVITRAADGAATYAGGIIAPGLNLSLEALYHAAAKLPKVAVARPPQVVGRGTVGAIQSGLYWGYVSLVEGLLARITAEAFPPDATAAPVILSTGGLGRLLSREIPAIACYDADLTMKGLQLLDAARLA